MELEPMLAVDGIGFWWRVAGQEYSVKGSGTCHLERSSGSALPSVFLVWGIIAQRYIWPALRRHPRADALRPILLLHAFRFVGLSFLIPGVVSPALPAEFAGPAAYGDLATAVLALLALATLRSTLGIALAWICNVLGTVDLLFAFYQGDRTGLAFDPGLQGAAYFIPTVLVPLLLIAHGLAFRLLLRSERPLNAS